MSIKKKREFFPDDDGFNQEEPALDEFNEEIFDDEEDIEASEEETTDPEIHEEGFPEEETFEEAVDRGENEDVAADKKVSEQHCLEEELSMQEEDISPESEAEKWTLEFQPIEKKTSRRSGKSARPNYGYYQVKRSVDSDSDDLQPDPFADLQPDPSVGPDFDDLQTDQSGSSDHGGSRSGKSARPNYGYSQSGKSARPKPVVYVPIDEEELRIPEVSARKKHKGLKVTGVAALMILVAAGSAYAGVSYYYSDKFFDGTTINGIDCSRKTPYEVEQLIARDVESYSIQISSRNLEPQVIEGSLIDYKYVSDGEVMKLLEQQKPYEWIQGFFEQKSYTISENITYSKELLQNQVLQLNCAQEENQVAPENAYVAFAESEFKIVPETEGSELNVKQAYQILDDAVSGKQETVDFASSEDAYVPAAVTSEDPGLQATLNACNNFTKASITYTFGEQTVTLDGSTIKDWLEFDEKGQYVQDDAAFQQHIKDYVAQLAAQYDTVGTSREFYTTSGRTVSVYGSAYGWKIDQDAEAAQLTQEIQSGTQITRDPVYSMTANSRGYNDLGNTYIEVDLSAQHMYYYQNGSIIFDSAIVSGNMSYSDRQTPSGIYTLYYKKSPDVLRGPKNENGEYEYETEVQYWMPFNGGIGFHDAPWQPYFGGDRYLTGGSHGCINMPSDSAAVLYSIIQYGVPIICFY